MACACKYNSVPGIQLPVVTEERSGAKLLMAISLTISWKRSYPRNEEAEKQHKNEGISPRFRIFFGAPRATQTTAVMDDFKRRLETRRRQRERRGSGRV